MADPDRKMNRDRTVYPDNTRSYVPSREEVARANYIKFLQGQYDPGEMTPISNQQMFNSQQVDKWAPFRENVDALATNVVEGTDPGAWAKLAGAPLPVQIGAGIVGAGLVGGGLGYLGKKAIGLVERGAAKNAYRQAGAIFPGSEEEYLAMLAEKAARKQRLIEGANEAGDVRWIKERDLLKMPKEEARIISVQPQMSDAERFGLEELAKRKALEESRLEAIRRNKEAIELTDREISLSALAPEVAVQVKPKKVFPKLSDADLEAIRRQELRSEREGLQRGVNLKYPVPPIDAQEQELIDLMLEMRIQGKPMGKIMNMFKSPNVKP